MPSRDENRRIWGQEYDWSKGGSEWATRTGWKDWILAHTLQAYLRPGLRVLEIGPGSGRWTEELVKYDPAELTLVDLVEKTLEICRRRFEGSTNLKTYVNDGRTLDFLDAESVDFVWSFDCFVHVEKDDVDSYFGEFRRVLAPGGIGIVHYASLDRCPDPAKPALGWRSRMTSMDMFEILERHGFRLLSDMYHADLSNADSSIAVFGR